MSRPTNLFNTPSSRFLALQTRNPLASHAFIYSVTTTKIYCRPTCPSRLARRANIRFHNTPAEAAADGFRPCKRCKPDDLEGELDEQVIMVRRACNLIGNEGKGAKGKWSVKGLAKDVGLTESHFCRVFKKVMGMTVGEYRSLVKGNGKGAGGSSMEVIKKGGLKQDLEVSIRTPMEGAKQSDGFLAPPKPTILDDAQISSNVETVEVLSMIEGDIDCDFSAYNGNEDCFEFFDFGSPVFVEISI